MPVASTLRASKHRAVDDPELDLSVRI